ncbi:MAG: hypothetical protein LBQ92_02515 [Propionibacteriaceae bacterium]|jgi:nicotinate-nucleotide pyrophosphorylase (carboxylating)|nr:hypothetical protein [Propionibacteriaceae bacterium]
MLPELLVKPLVAAALAEDLGRRGDITTEATIPAEKHGTVALVAREAGVVAGLQCAVLAWELVAESAPGGQPVAVAVAKPDGAAVRPGETIATISGPVRALLTGERVALNFLGHLSGVATATAQIAQAIAHTKSKVADTR